MRMRRLSIVLVLVLAPSAARADEARLISLEEALLRADTLAPAGREIAAGIERARSEIAASGLWPNPDLSLVREESAGVVERFATLSQTFPLTGRLSLERDAARSGAAAAEADARRDRAALHAQVRAAFTDLLFAQERSAELGRGRTRLAELVATLRVREEAGESSGFDRMRAERELADVEADDAEAEGRLAAAAAALAPLVALPSRGLRASGALTPGPPLPDQEALAALVSMRGDLVALDAQAERADLLARAARRRAVPDASLTVGTKTTDAGTDDDRGPVIGLGLSLPLFDRGQGGRSVATAEAALLRARRDHLARSIEAGIASAHAEASARRRAEDQYDSHGDPEDLVRIARAAYEAGSMRILDLLDAYRTTLAVRLRSLELHAGARRAEAALGLALGCDLPIVEESR
ncbi:MAG TPA: TolC family protein [Candidatus Polarisedimenticolia bacterium]|jgi:cobalt-zinc-cadmium efflux system outer membrane protein|nr:TolC family protein [Candidatus Polarisedimenticolia bacterium]